MFKQCEIVIRTINYSVTYYGNSKQTANYKQTNKQTTATANNTAAQNRLTISVNVRFYDKNDEEADFEKRFSFYYDYAGSSQLIGSQKDSAVEEIFERITQDVFNASLAKW